MVAAKGAGVVVDRDQHHPPVRPHPGLFLQLAGGGGLGRLAAFDAAAREVPAGSVTVLDQQDAALVVEDHDPHADRQTADLSHGDPVGRREQTIEAAEQRHRRSLGRPLAAREARG